MDRLPNVDSARVEIVISEDGGETFGALWLVQALTGRNYSVWPGIWDAVHFPSACSDCQAGVIYVAYQGFVANDRRSNMFTRSIKKGRTWSQPVPMNDKPDNRDAFNPAIAGSPDGQHVTVEFYDQRNQTATSAGNNADLYLAESAGGALGIVLARLGLNALVRFIPPDLPRMSEGVPLDGRTFAFTALIALATGSSVSCLRCRRRIRPLHMNWPI
jgi:hypothetical protein